VKKNLLNWFLHLLLLQQHISKEGASISQHFKKNKKRRQTNNNLTWNHVSAPSLRQLFFSISPFLHFFFFFLLMKLQTVLLFFLKCRRLNLKGFWWKMRLWKFQTLVKDRHKKNVFSKNFQKKKWSICFSLKRVCVVISHEQTKTCNNRQKFLKFETIRNFSWGKIQL